MQKLTDRELQQITQENEYYKKYYSSLEGATIVRFQGMQAFDEDDVMYSRFPVFLVKFADGTYREIAISQDPELNSGGYITGLPNEI